jgi:hypothetical protein
LQQQIDLPATIVAIRRPPGHWRETIVYQRLGVMSGEHRGLEGGTTCWAAARTAGGLLNIGGIVRCGIRSDNRLY